MGASCTFCGHLALLEETSLGHTEIGSCVFRKNFYGGSWGGMRSPHRISAQSKVVWRVNQHFEKTAKVSRLPAEFPMEWPSMGSCDWAEILCRTFLR